MFRLHDVRHQREGGIVDQHRAKQTLLGFDIDRLPLNPSVHRRGLFIFL
jgi:hypothetical protein